MDTINIKITPANKPPTYPILMASPNFNDKSDAIFWQISENSTIVIKPCAGCNDQGRNEGFPFGVVPFNGKVTLSNNIEKKPEFPRLVVYKPTGEVYLQLSRDTGIILTHKDNSGFNIGFRINAGDAFHACVPFNGKITLSN
jgi:hypothetical protein